MIRWSEKDKCIVYDNNEKPIVEVGIERMSEAFNDTGKDIKSGSAVYITGYDRYTYINKKIKKWKWYYYFLFKKPFIMGKINNVDTSMFEDSDKLYMNVDNTGSLTK